MFDYQKLKQDKGKLVAQTIDSPIMVFDYWELSDAFIALMIILVFGVLFYSWGTMMFLLVFCLILGPIVKKKYGRGIYLHAPYYLFHLSLPGLINPQGRTLFSD